MVGGGITGVAVAREAQQRGLKVALVEKRDFSWGTSSRTSKLIHGGLRYLENLELKLVFEALSERTHLLKSVPHLVKPLKFFFPVYRDTEPSKFKLGLGMWLYDLLSLFRAPGFHKNLNASQFSKTFPHLRQEGLQGGFMYYDAMMRDDLLGIQVAREAAASGADLVNYVEATDPIIESGKVSGFHLVDNFGGGERTVRARRVILCGGPWTDLVGSKINREWKNRLKVSKGVHLLFDLKRFPVQDAMVMQNPDDGRISFVIARPDYGDGMVIVGTTDSPVQSSVDNPKIKKEDVDYLMHLLGRYFPELQLTHKDIVSAYVGIRPLVDPNVSAESDEPGSAHDDAGNPQEPSLQKVSREHHIETLSNGVTFVVGGKYTTHRSMAHEVVQEMLKAAAEDESDDSVFAQALKKVAAVNNGQAGAPSWNFDSLRVEAQKEELEFNDRILEEYGDESLEVFRIHQSKTSQSAREWPEAFPMLGTQLRYHIRHSMTLHLNDFYFRRVPLYFARSDHGKPWAEALANIWAEELGLDQARALAEMDRLFEGIDQACEFKAGWK